MKTSFASCKLAAVAVLASAALPLAARAQFAFPSTVPNGGGLWYLSDNTVAMVSGNPSGGLGFSDAEFAAAAGGVDGLDGGFVMRINDTLFASPTGNSMSGNTFNSGTSTYSGLAVQAQFAFLGSSFPVVRALYTFNNPSNSTVTATFSWEVNLGSDVNTVVRASGSNAPAASARWLVTSDSLGTNPVVTLARYGNNAPHAPDASSNWPGSTSTNRLDLLADQYSVKLAPGQTVRLMMFGELNSVAGGLAGGINNATNAAQVFDSISAMNSAGLLAGLPSDLNSIINWGLAVPEPGAGTLLSLALVAWCARTRQRR